MNYESVILFDLLYRMYEVLRERYPANVNRKQVIRQQDTYIKMTMNKIKELNGIELLPHPPYSPDLVASVYYLFRSMAHFLRGRQFNDV